MTPTFVYCLQFMLFACCAGCTARAAPALLLQLSFLRRAHHDGLVRERVHDLTFSVALAVPLDPPEWSETARAPPRTAAELHQLGVLDVECQQRTDRLCAWELEAEQRANEQLDSTELQP